MNSKRKSFLQKKTGETQTRISLNIYFFPLLMSIRSLTLDPCRIRSRKFHIILSEPLGEKPVSKLPGIGIHTQKHFEKGEHMTRAKDLLEKFISKFHSNDEEFRLWLMKDYALPEYRATECCVALIDYIEQAKKNQWSLLAEE